VLSKFRGELTLLDTKKNDSGFSLSEEESTPASLPPDFNEINDVPF
jgi:hypothetical protein